MFKNYCKIIIENENFNQRNLSKIATEKFLEQKFRQTKSFLTKLWTKTILLNKNMDKIIFWNKSLDENSCFEPMFGRNNFSEQKFGRKQF